VRRRKRISTNPNWGLYFTSRVFWIAIIWREIFLHKEHGDTWIDACVLVFVDSLLTPWWVWHYVCDALKIRIAVIFMLSSHCCYCGDFSAVS
jgi:hypothetical protein